MIPKIIHLCWFSNEPYPVEIKTCLNSWKKILPDYTLRVWKEQDARKINYNFVNEALDAHKWAFAADVIRFYAVYEEGGLYMDSDILLYRRPDEIMKYRGFITTMEKDTKWGLQAAFFAGEKGNKFCLEMLNHYKHSTYIYKDGSFNKDISPDIMFRIAQKWGIQYADEFQNLGDLIIFPTYFLAPKKSYPKNPQTIGVHLIYGSWRNRKTGRRIELKIKHFWHIIKYFFQYDIHTL